MTIKAKTVSYSSLCALELANSNMVATLSKAQEERKNGAKKSAEAKRRIMAETKKWWEANGRCRGFNEANRLQQKLFSERGVTRSAKTIYDWICDW